MEVLDAETAQPNSGLLHGKVQETRREDKKLGHTKWCKQHKGFEAGRKART
jgi:hypothetical protein